MTLRIRPNAIEQDHGPFTFPGATINGDLNIDGDLTFQGPQTITTTSGDLTISPADQVYFTTKVGVGTDSPTFIEGSGIHIADATAPVLRLQDSNQVNSDWEIRSPSAGNRLEFFHVNTAKVQLSLSSAGKFGIHPSGYVAPDGTLHVHTATAGAVTAHASADDLIVENSAAGGISILTPANVAGNIFFGDPGSNQAGIVQYDHSSVRMNFFVETTAVLRLYETEMRSVIPIKIFESADDTVDTAGYGQFWVKDDAPCIPMFTDDVGTKFTIDVTPV